MLLLLIVASYGVIVTTWSYKPNLFDSVLNTIRNEVVPSGKSAEMFHAAVQNQTRFVAAPWAPQFSLANGWPGIFT